MPEAARLTEATQESIGAPIETSVAARREEVFSHSVTGTVNGTDAHRHLVSPRTMLLNQSNQDTDQIDKHPCSRYGL